MKKCLLLLLCAVLCLSAASGQAVQDAQGKEEETAEGGKKSYLVGLSAAIVPSLVIGSWNRFVARQSWAQVSWNDMKHFYDRDMEWDDDWYWTNFVLHPYQGSLYYMGARNANLNPVESFGVTLLGSAIWEWFFETNAPSKNDMVYTTVGAFAVGEMFYRIGLEAGELWKPLGYVFNPLRLYTDFATGHKPAGSTGNIYSLSFRTYVGAAWGYTKPKHIKALRETFPGFMGLEASVAYKDPYGHDSNKPYSQFDLTLGGSLGFSSGEGYKPLEEKLGYNIHIFSNGMLWARAPEWGDNLDTTLGFSMNYDFVWQSFYDFSSLAPGVAIKQRVKLASSKLEWQAHLGAILLGTTDFYYIRRHLVEPEGLVRPYSYTVGGEFVGALSWRFNSGQQVDFSLHSYAMYDFYNQRKKGADTGWEFLAYAMMDYELPVSDRIVLGMESNLYVKESLYKHYPDVFAILGSGSLYAKIRLGN